MSKKDEKTKFKAVLRLYPEFAEVSKDGEKYEKVFAVDLSENETHYRCKVKRDDKTLTKMVSKRAVLSVDYLEEDFDDDEIESPE